RTMRYEPAAMARRRTTATAAFYRGADVARELLHRLLRRRLVRILGRRRGVRVRGRGRGRAVTGLLGHRAVALRRATTRNEGHRKQCGTDERNGLLHGIPFQVYGSDDSPSSGDWTAAKADSSSLRACSSFFFVQTSTPAR